jgi:membrane protease YdiL (CAAX protease family)
MTTVPTAPRRARAEWLPVVAAVTLVAFYYLVRADTIGVFAGARGWHALTAPPLPMWLHFVAAAIVLGVIPVAVARRLTGSTCAQLGLGLGDWRAGLRWFALGAPIAVLAGRIGAAAPAMRAVYPLDPTLDASPERFIPYALLAFLYFGAWEVLFRGVLLFGLRQPLGLGAANATQTAVSVTAHFGRALDETFAALPAGLVFGWVTGRIGSVWYIAVVHWLVATSLDWFILTT